MKMHELCDAHPPNPASSAARKRNAAAAAGDNDEQQHYKYSAQDGHELRIPPPHGAFEHGRRFLEAHCLIVEIFRFDDQAIDLFSALKYLLVVVNGAGSKCSLSKMHVVHDTMHHKTCSKSQPARDASSHRTFSIFWTITLLTSSRSPFTLLILSCSSMFLLKCAVCHGSVTITSVTGESGGRFTTCCCRTGEKASFRDMAAAVLSCAACACYV